MLPTFQKSNRIKYLHQNDEQFIIQSENILECGLKHLLEKNVPRDEVENLILFTRLWHGYLSMTGHCFSCNFDIEANDEFTCDICLTDNIVLNEAIHFEGFLNNISNYTFFSNLPPTITTRYALTENNLHTGMQKKFWECTNRETRVVLPFSNMCCKEILSNVCNFRWDLLPLPMPILNKLRNICKMMTHKDAWMDERCFSTWVMTSCQLYTVIGQFEVEEGLEDSCPIQ